MRYIKTFSLFESVATIYDIDWQDFLPKEMIVVKDGVHKFEIGNIMKHSDMVQVTYSNKNGEWGVPGTLEFDFYFSHGDQMRIDIDVTWGDSMACEFYIESPDKVGVIEYTSYRSKMDPSNTVFALEDESLEAFVSFLNRFDGFKLDSSQLNFLDKRDDYQPQ